MPRPKGSKNKPKTNATTTVKRIRAPREKKVANTLHVGKSTWVRPTHYYVISHEVGNTRSFFTYTEKEDGAYKLCAKLNSESVKGIYKVYKLPYNT